MTKISDQPIPQHPIVVLPIIYDIGNQITQLVDRRDLNTHGMMMQAANLHLRKFLEKRGVATTDSSLYAAIHDLLSNLTLPMPQIPGQPGPMPGGPPFMQGPMAGQQNQQMPMQSMGQQQHLPPDHPQAMNPQGMGQSMGGQGMGGQGMGGQGMIGQPGMGGQGMGGQPGMGGPNMGGQPGLQMNQGYGMGQMGGQMNE